MSLTCSIGSVIDLLYRLIALLHIVSNHLLSAAQSGLVRRYAFGIAIGAVIIIGMVVLR